MILFVLQALMLDPNNESLMVDKANLEVLYYTVYCNIT